MSADASLNNPLFAPESPLMRPQALHRGEMCTDVAIPLIATGGCRAVSAGALAGPLQVTPAAVLKWFGSTARMWEALAVAIGRRWYSYLSAASRLQADDEPFTPFADLDLSSAVSLFLPLNGDEIEWTRVWLSMLEHGRHHELVGVRLAGWEAQELEALHRATTCRSIGTLTATMVVVRGLRQMVASTHAPLTLETAHQLLLRHLEHAYLERGIPEPAGDDDVLPSTRRFTLLPSISRRRRKGRLVRGYQIPALESAPPEVGQHLPTPPKSPEGRPVGNQVPTSSLRPPDPAV